MRVALHINRKVKKNNLRLHNKMNLSPNSIVV